MRAAAAAWWLPPLVCALWGALLFSPSFLTHNHKKSNNNNNTLAHRGYDLTFDDRAAILNNGDVKRPWLPECTQSGKHYKGWWTVECNPWLRMWTTDFWGLPLNHKDSHKSWRPLTTATFRFNYLIGGENGFSYHVVNVAVHSLACFLVPHLAHTLTGSLSTAWVAGLLFASHAVHVEAVASTVSRADTLGSVAAMVGVRLYIAAAASRRATFRSVVALVGALAAIIIGTLCKEVAFTTLAAFVAYDLILGNSKTSSSSSHVRSRKCWLLSRWIAIACTGLGYFLVRLPLHGGVKLHTWTLEENQFASDPPGWPRRLSIAATHAEYLRFMVLPTGLAFDHGVAARPRITGFADFRNVWTVLAYGSLAAFVAWLVAKRHRVALFGTVWALAAFAPASNVIITVGTELAERLLYLPRSWSWRLVVLALIAFHVVQTCLYLPAWASDATLFERGLATHPLSLKALHNVSYFLRDGTKAQALRALRLVTTSLAMWPKDRLSHFSAGVALLRLQYPVQAIMHIRTALALAAEEGISSKTQCHYRVFLINGLTDYASVVGGGAAWPTATATAAPDTVAAVAMQEIRSAIQAGCTQSGVYLLAAIVARGSGQLMFALKYTHRQAQRAYQQVLTEQAEGHVQAGGSGGMVSQCQALEQLVYTAKQADAKDMLRSFLHYHSEAVAQCAAEGRQESLLRMNNVATELEAETDLKT